MCWGCAEGCWPPLQPLPLLGREHVLYVKVGGVCFPSQLSTQGPPAAVVLQGRSLLRWHAEAKSSAWQGRPLKLKRRQEGRLGVKSPSPQPPGTEGKLCILEGRDSLGPRPGTTAQGRV